VVTWSWPTWVVESETFFGSRVHIVGVLISFEKNFYRLPFTPPSLVRLISPSSVNMYGEITKRPCEVVGGR
jgi:hypothetical protein